eukprot:scaffold10819_cov108-Isochrysis_galbana.AAC.2
MIFSTSLSTRDTVVLAEVGAPASSSRRTARRIGGIGRHDGGARELRARQGCRVAAEKTKLRPPFFLFAVLPLCPRLVAVDYSSSAASAQPPPHQHCSPPPRTTVHRHGHGWTGARLRPACARPSRAAHVPQRPAKRQARPSRLHHWLISSVSTCGPSKRSAAGTARKETTAMHAPVSRPPRLVSATTHSRWLGVSPARGGPAPAAELPG